MMQVFRDRHERALDGIGKLESLLSFRLAVMQRLLDRQMVRILDRHRLSLPAYRVLITIEAFDEIAAADLVRLVAVDKGQISRCCQELTAIGLIASRPDPKSARRKLLRLSQVGVAKLAALKPDVDARNEALDAELDGVERAALDRAISKLTRHAAESLDQDMTGRVMPNAHHDAGS